MLRSSIPENDVAGRRVTDGRCGGDDDDPGE
jgi:hypothetical protein